MKEFILKLDAEALSLANAGGKGANLNRLIRAGMPVPPGYVISTAAYRHFVAANELQAEIERISQVGKDPAAFEDASRQIRDLFSAGSMPDELAMAIGEAVQDFGDRPLAARSSATAEDLPEASFAGQQESYLNVRGRKALLEAVRLCWSSLWTARAMAYRREQGISPAEVSLAVVVQEMAPAESAGVLFTINPLTGNRGEMLVNATWGLGESLVAGRVNPDSLVLDKASGEIKEQELGDKALMTRAAEAGTAEVPVPEEQRSLPAITAEEAAELAALCRQVEALFGSPQDIEWALASGRIYLLQSRPVTALDSQAPGQAPGDDAWPPQINVAPLPFDYWSQMDMGERWPEPVTPFTWSTAEPMIAENQARSDSVRAIKGPFVDQVQWSRREYGRVYFNEGAMVHLLRDGFGMPAASISSAMGGQAHDQGADDGWRWGTFIRRIPAVVKMSLKWERDLKEYPDLFPIIDDWVETFLAADLSAADDAQLWAESQSIWYRRLMDAMDYHAVATGASSNNMGMLVSFVKRSTGDEQFAYRLMSGLKDVIAAEIVPALWQMANKLRELGLADVVLKNDPAMALTELRRALGGEPFLELLEAFLRRHGHRCMSEAEWLFPRWIEVPEQVVESIGGYLRAGDEYNPLAAEAKQRQDREQATAEVEGKLDPLRRAYFRWALRRAHNTIRLRDNGQHYLVKLLLPMRIIYATLGQRWASRDWLEEADDFFFLVVPEIEGTIFAGKPQKAGLDLRKIVAQRRVAYDYWRTARFPETLGVDGRPMRPVLGVSATDVLSGIPASGGLARGRAAVIQSPAEAGRVEAGQILVTRSTDPGWTPLFSIVDGLVLEVGGQLSHGAIVAREYGLPAVVNVAEATSRIRDGLVVVVDGTEGVVRLGVEEQRSGGEEVKR
jgi:pyruvate,water dikinase